MWSKVGSRINHFVPLVRRSDNECIGLTDDSEFPPLPSSPQCNSVLNLYSPSKDRCTELLNEDITDLLDEDTSSSNSVNDFEEKHESNEDITDLPNEDTPSSNLVNDCEEKHESKSFESFQNTLVSSAETSKELHQAD